ncbi:hypothetical protein EUGRSUZ_J02908, partial [Eucalyptus grandis]
DLSDNQLTGAIPESLANLPKLRILNLSGNKLNGSIPEALKRRHDDKTLDLRVKKEFYITCFIVIQSKYQGRFDQLSTIQSGSRNTHKNLFGTESSERMLRLKNRPFKYGEVSRITRNFGQVIGEGGFGKVYLGALENGTVVAVKMLSESSKQGYKEFQAELITGRPPIMRSRDGSANMRILKWLIPIIESGDIQSIMDPRLQGEFNINLAWKVVEIAMSCTRPTSIQRPDINHVLAELKESLVSTSSGSFEMTSLKLHSNNAPVAR